MRGLADKAFAAGSTSSCSTNGTAAGPSGSAGLYHSGLTADADYVIRELAGGRRRSAIVVAGYSLGGNLALKLAGDYGDAAPPQLRAVCAISPVIELEAVRPRARAPAERRLSVELRARAEGPHAPQGGLFPGASRSNGLDAIRTVREFDEVYTAPHFGFRDASDYYYRASAMRVIDRVRVPARIITAEDDPFVPSSPVPRSDRPFEPAPRRDRHDATAALRVRYRRARRQRRLLGGTADPRLRRGAHLTAISRRA